MTFFVLDPNPVKSANQLCWLDCESAAHHGARIILTAFHNEDEDSHIKNHPLVKWAVVSKENARWLYRYTRTATIKWGKEHKMEDYKPMMEKLNDIASSIDEMLPQGQLTLFGNFYIDGEIEALFKQESIDANKSFYEETRKHLSWGDHDPKLYGGEEE